MFMPMSDSKQEISILSNIRQTVANPPHPCRDQLPSAGNLFFSLLLPTQPNLCSHFSSSIF